MDLTVVGNNPLTLIRSFSNGILIHSIIYFMNSLGWNTLSNEKAMVLLPNPWHSKMFFSICECLNSQDVPCLTEDDARAFSKQHDFLNSNGSRCIPILILESCCSSVLESWFLEWSPKFCYHSRNTQCQGTHPHHLLFNWPLCWHTSFCVVTIGLQLPCSVKWGYNKCKWRRSRTLYIQQMKIIPCTDGPIDCSFLELQ